VFDLDYTLWPFFVFEHLSGPFQTGDSAGAAVCNSKERDSRPERKTVHLFPDVVEILESLKGNGVLMGVASSSPDISHAANALRAFGVYKYFTPALVCVQRGSGDGKAKHFQKILSFCSKQRICNHDIIFFDDMSYNVRLAHSIGVCAIKLQKGTGLNWPSFDHGLKLWEQESKGRSFMKTFFSQPKSETAKAAGVPEKPIQESNILREWETIQNEVRKKVVVQDKFDVQKLKYVGGCDISFVNNSDVDAVSGLVVFEFPGLKLVYEAYRRIELTHPYISGFLAFREVEYFQVLLEELKEKNPEYYPGLLMCDGNGILHPNRVGAASHLGVLMDLPTLGVGKSFLNCDGLAAKEVEKEMQKTVSVFEEGHMNIVSKFTGEVLGAAFSKAGVKKPVYVSPGHRISTSTAVALVSRCSPKFRIPVPIRQADLASREYVRSLDMFRAMELKRSVIFVGNDCKVVP
jgi:deoxyribonuclease V